MDDVLFGSMRSHNVAVALKKLDLFRPEFCEVIDRYITNVKDENEIPSTYLLKVIEHSQTI